MSEFATRPKGKHLTYDDRYKIEWLYKQGQTQRQIAFAVGVSQQTISRELRRGMVDQLDGETWQTYRIYSAQVAQQKADFEKTSHGPGLKIGKNFAYLDALERLMLAHFSPYAAIQKLAHENKFEMCISKTTCYRYIKDGLFQRLKFSHLPNAKNKKHAGETKRIRASRPDHRSIESRSFEIAARSTFGHWEGDSIIGKAKGKGESLLVFTERLTRQEVVLKVQDKTAAETVNAVRRLKRYFGADFSQLFRTITFDNGSEFADQTGVEKTGVMVFYAHPSAPHERGSNENANRLLRRIFPKGQTLQKVTQKQAAAAQHFANHYPRKLFDGQTAAARFWEEVQRLPLRNPDKVKVFFALA